jgi:hypothetical protein
MVANRSEDFQGVLVGSIVGEQGVTRRGFGPIIHRTVGTIVGEAIKAYRSSGNIMF